MPSTSAPGSQVNDWSSRPSLESRRRNQWRQFKQMAPDFGPTTAETVPQAPTAPLREASLPTFKPRTSYTSASSSNQDNLVAAKFPPQARPLQMHPHSAAHVGFTPTPPATVASKVTPLRPLPQRVPSQAATSAAQALTSPPALSSTPPLAGREAGGALRSRQPRRRLGKPPLPVLYLIRLVILGVGVAAIAGTLLSVLSPSNMASSKRGEATAIAPSEPFQGGIAKTGATTLADLQPTSELTRLKAQLEQLATLTPGLTPSLYVLDLDSGRYVDIGGGQAVAAASTIKVPLLVAFLQQVDAGTIALNQAVALQEHHLAGGSGSMANEAVGSEYTALEVATRMIIDSDNTATNIMIEALGGQEALNQQFASWGLESTVLRNPLPDLEGTNTTSPKDLALLMALVDQGGMLSARSRDRLLSIMQRTVNRSLIPFSLTDGSIIANKTGDIAMALGDVALIDTPNGNRYALAVMVQRPNNDGRASELIRRITETTHKELNQPIAPVGRPASAPQDPTLPEGTGDSTEMETPAGVDGSTGEGGVNTREGATDPEGAPPNAPYVSPDPSLTPQPAPTGDQVPPG